MNQVLARLQKAPGLHGFGPGNLRHPGRIGVLRETGNVNPPTADMQEKEHVIGHQAAPRPHLCSEEIGGHQDV